MVRDVLAPNCHLVDAAFNPPDLHKIHNKCINNAVPVVAAHAHMHGENEVFLCLQA